MVFVKYLVTCEWLWLCSVYTVFLFFMAAGYDENVLENPFFKSLKGKFSQIYDDASSKRLTVKCFLI